MAINPSDQYWGMRQYRIKLCPGGKAFFRKKALIKPPGKDSILAPGSLGNQVENVLQAGGWRKVYTVKIQTSGKGMGMNIGKTRIHIGSAQVNTGKAGSGCRNLIK
jgi:hypothetical protein